MSTSTDPYDQMVCNPIGIALLDPQGINTVNADAYVRMTNAGNIILPCQIDKQITLYLS